MKIINDNEVLDFLDKENNFIPPNIYTKQVQGHLDYKCGCKIIQDDFRKEFVSSLFPCNTHHQWANTTIHINQRNH